jgi:hypothetical protein
MEAQASLGMLTYLLTYYLLTYLLTGWAPGPVWTGAENLAPPGFDPRTVQPVASRYTVLATHTYIYICIYIYIYIYNI